MRHYVENCSHGRVLEVITGERLSRLVHLNYCNADLRRDSASRTYVDEKKSEEQVYVSWSQVYVYWLQVYSFKGVKDPGLNIFGEPKIFIKQGIAKDVNVILKRRVREHGRDGICPELSHTNHPDTTTDVPKLHIHEIVVITA